MREPGQRLHAERDRFVTELWRGHETHPARRPGRGEIPRPLKARSVERWGH
jgi:hypothetical protein